ncbi:cytochrome P450 [Tribonema minus]|uniref:Cytochrome P450 n=1 Tax=Tribonema minus TaxID=303371 RepID=A0A835Z8P8_9STRA|nr:cytochrome P450 [Tribonema minus]
MAVRATLRLAEKLDEAAETGGTVDIGEEFRHLTLQASDKERNEVLLSIGPEESDRVFAKLYLPIVIECHKRVWNPLRTWCAALPAWWRFQRNIRDLNAYISGMIRARWALRQREGGDKVLQLGGAMLGGRMLHQRQGSDFHPPDAARRGDVLDRLLDGVAAAGAGLTAAAHNQVRDELKTLVLAGHETSASMLNWALLELLQPGNGAQLRRAVAEADAAAAAAGGAPQAAAPAAPDGAALGYLEACLREALRKYSIVPITSRVCAKDTTLRGPGGAEHAVPRGAIVMALLQGVHHRADLWPRPSCFEPERFCDAGGAPIAPAPYTYLPFIEGPRACLGQNLSLLESKVVLSLLLRKYEFEVAMGGTDPCSKHKWLIPVIPASNTVVSVTKREV